VKWDRQTVKMVVIVFVTVAFTSWVIKFAVDHDGETITIGGTDQSQVAADPGSGPGPGADEVETGDTDPESGLPWVVEEDLPVFAQGTLALIDQGGPFPCGKDGATFHNREGILPDHESGYYAEYTVLSATSCEGPRGELRIVTGEGGEFYWTEDHYESFERIARRAG
jgi:ribonuclease T1